MKEAEIKIFNLTLRFKNKIVLPAALALIITSAIWGFSEGLNAGMHRLTH